MPIHRKIKAFTLVEVSITILLSLIVVGMMYMAFQIIVRQINQIDNGEIENIGLVKMALNHAFFESNIITYSEEKNMLECRDSIDTYQFIIQPNQIIFRSSKNEEDDILFEGVYNFRIEQEVNEMVKAIHLSFPVQKDTFQLLVQKQYRSSTLLNHKNIGFEY